MSFEEEIWSIVRTQVELDEFEMVPIHGMPQGLKRINGLLLPNMIRNVSSLKNLEVKSDDTFVIGYPKSGTTWTEEIVWLLKNDCKIDSAKSKHHWARVIWIDMGLPKSFYDSMPRPRCFKSHLPIRFFPDNFNKIAKVVYVARNPKDVLVSYYNMSKVKKGDEFFGTLDEFVDLFARGGFKYGPWWDHLNQYENLDGVHIIHYEDLIEKPVETVKELANYLDVTISDDQLKSLLNFVSFDNMKNEPSLNMDFNNSIFTSDLKFYFKGKIGNWKAYLTEEQSAKIDEMVKANLRIKRPIQYEPSLNNTNE